MSKIVSPYPILVHDKLWLPTPGSKWWRLYLRTNSDGYYLMTRTDCKDGDMASASWVSWEFFDGEDTIIDLGFDRPVVPQIFHARDRFGPYLDVLHTEPPTPCRDWMEVHFTTRIEDEPVWPHPCACTAYD